MTIEINTWEDIQGYKEKYLIPLGVSITRWLRETLEGLKEDGFEEVEMSINPDLLPHSYGERPTVWGRVLNGYQIYPNLQLYRKDGRVIVYASQHHKQTKFIQTVIQNLNEYGHSKHRFEELPEGYQRQPYPLLARLRDKGINAKIRITNKLVTVYVPSKR